MAVINKCKHCGEDLESFMKFCGGCGTPVEDSGEGTGGLLEESGAKQETEQIIEPEVEPTVESAVEPVTESVAELEMESAAESANESSETRCKSCGGTIDSSMRFCSICGNPLEPFGDVAGDTAATVPLAMTSNKSVPSNPTVKSGTAKFGKLILSLAAVVVVLLVAGVLKNLFL